MICNFCKHEIITKKIDNLFYVNYCDNCNLYFIKFNVFKQIILNKLEIKKYNNILKQVIIDDLNDNFFKYQFGLSVDRMNCLNKVECKSNQHNCHLIEYNYNRHDFYFCFYEDLIICEDTLLNKLLKTIKHKVYFKYIWNKIKNLFIRNK